MLGDLSTEGFGPLCWVLKNPDAARPVTARIGAARRGWDWPVELWHGNRCRRQHWELRLPLLLSSESRCGTAWSGRVSYGEVKSDELGPGIVKGCRQQYGGFALPTVLSGTGVVRRGPAIHVSAGLGAAR